MVLKNSFMTKKLEDQHGAFRGKDIKRSKEDTSVEVDEDPVGNAVELEEMAESEENAMVEFEVGKAHQSPPLPPDSPIQTSVDPIYEEKPELVTKIEGLDMEDIKLVNFV